jgi:hypothetical protein
MSSEQCIISRVGIKKEDTKTNAIFPIDEFTYTSRSSKEKAYGPGPQMSILIWQGWLFLHMNIIHPCIHPSRGFQ